MEKKNVLSHPVCYVFFVQVCLESSAPELYLFSNHFFFFFLFRPAGHICGGRLPHHRQDCLHLGPGRVHPELQARGLHQQQVCGVPDTPGRQRVLQLHHTLPPAVMEHVHGSRYLPIHFTCVLRTSIRSALGGRDRKRDAGHLRNHPSHVRPRKLMPIHTWHIFSLARSASRNVVSETLACQNVCLNTFVAPLRPRSSCGPFRSL